MSVRKHRYSTRDGGSGTTRAWYVFFRDHKGRRRKLPGYEDKAATQELERLIKSLMSYRSSGTTLTPEMARRVEQLKPGTLLQLAKWGILDSARVAALKPISDLLGDFKLSLISSGRSEKHVQGVTGKADRVLRGIGASRLGDIEALKVERYLKGLRDGDDGISVQTSNHYLAAVGQFCRWSVSHGLLVANPLQHVKKLAVSKDRRRIRRDMPLDDLQRLLGATQSSGTHHGLSGPARALVYRLAASTGLRAKELSSLKVSSFDLEGPNPTLRLAAKDAKNSQDAVVHLKTSLVEAIECHCEGLGPWDHLFDVPKGWRTAEMLRQDLKAAGIPVADERGRVLDFHALRHTFVSNALRSGASAKAVQRAARHSTPMLTVGTYGHAEDAEVRQVVESLPDLDAPTDEPESEVLAATGTDGGAPLQLADLVPGLVPDDAAIDRDMPLPTVVWRRREDSNPRSVARRRFSKLLPGLEVVLRNFLLEQGFGAVEARAVAGDWCACLAQLAPDTPSTNGASVDPQGGDRRGSTPAWLPVEVEDAWGLLPSQFKAAVSLTSRAMLAREDRV